MFPVNGKWFLESTHEPNREIFLVNQGATWRTFTQYGDAEAFAKRMDQTLNDVTILTVKPVLHLPQKST